MESANDNGSGSLDEIIESLAKEEGARTEDQKKAIRQMAEQYADACIIDSFKLPGPYVGGDQMSIPVVVSSDGKKKVSPQFVSQFKEPIKMAYRGLMSPAKPAPAVALQDSLQVSGSSPSDSFVQHAVELDVIYDEIYNNVLADATDAAEQKKVRPIVINALKKGVNGFALAEEIGIVYVSAKDEIEKNEKIGSLVEIVSAEYIGEKKTTKSFKVSGSIPPIPDKYKGVEIPFVSKPFHELVNFVNEVFVQPGGQAIPLGDITGFVSNSQLKRVKGAKWFVNADELYSAIVASEKWTDRRKATSEIDANAEMVEGKRQEAYELFRKYIEDPTNLDNIKMFMGMLKSQYTGYSDMPVDKDGNPRPETDYAMRRYRANKDYHDTVDSETDPLEVYHKFMSRQEAELNIMRDENVAYSTVGQKAQELEMKLGRLREDNDELLNVIKKMESEKLYTHSQLHRAREMNRALVRELGRAEKRARNRKVMGGKLARAPFKIGAAAAVIAAAAVFGYPYAMKKYDEHCAAQAEYNHSLDRFGNALECTLEKIRNARQIMEGRIESEPGQNHSPIPSPVSPELNPKPTQNNSPAYHENNPGMAYRRQHR